MRYIPDADAADGLPPGEGAFLACSFWLVNDLATDRAAQGGRGAVRPAAFIAERPRPLLRGVRPAAPTADREHAAGVHAPHADRERDRTVDEPRTRDPVGDVATVAPPSGDQFELSLDDQSRRRHRGRRDPALIHSRRHARCSMGSPETRRRPRGGARSSHPGPTGSRTGATPSRGAPGPPPSTNRRRGNAIHGLVRWDALAAWSHAVGPRRAPRAGAPSAAGVPMAARR